MKSDFLFFVVIKMSKKIIFLGILVLFAFVYWCGKNDGNVEKNQPSTDVSNVWMTPSDEIPVAETVDEWIIIMEWDRDAGAVEINEEFESAI